MGTKIIIIGLATIIFSVFFVFTANTLLARKKKLTKDQKFQNANKRFRFYYDFVLTRQQFRKVYTQVGSLSIYNFLETRLITVQFFERGMISAVVFFLIGFIGLGDIMSGVVMLFIAMVLGNTVVNKRIDDVNYSQMKALGVMLQSVREAYTRVRNIPDALNEAQCPAILEKNLNQIYMICTAVDAKDRLETFYKECPNRIIKTFATTCYIRADAGDDEDGEESPFKVALSLIKDEVDMEIRRQMQQRLMFRALDKLPFVPLIMYPFIQMFYTHLFSATASVFESGIGFVIKLSVLLSSFVSYYILSSINNPSIARTDDRMLFLVRAMSVHKVQRFAQSLITKKYRTRIIMQKKLTGCLSSKTIDYFYLEKFVYAVALFLFSMIATVFVLISARHSTWNSLSSSTMSMNFTYTAEQEKQTLDYDHSVLMMEECPPKQEMIDYFKTVFYRDGQTTWEGQANRLTQKYKTYNGLRFRWFYAFLFIGAAIGGWFIPEALLWIRVKMVRSEAEMDILQMQTVIAILMDTNLDTLSTLYWLTKSSDIHKDILSYCYHEYVRDPYKALVHLKQKSSSAEFTSMCDKLITTIHQITLKEAFEDLVSERTHLMKIREMVQLNELRAKRNIASPISTAPMMVWMFMDFVLPIAVVAVRSAVEMMDTLGNAGAL